MERGKRSFGQRAADNLSKWAGSWWFILLFLLFIGIWMIINGYILVKYSQGIFDPYPFILLNLILSCLAAIQAPIILMSQNRQNQIDRARAEYDYKVDRRAEREINLIQKKLEEIEKMIKKNSR